MSKLQGLHPCPRGKTPLIHLALIQLRSACCILALLWLASFSAVAMPVAMDDEEMSQISGQALIEMQKLTQNGFTFYTVGLDATLDMSINIQNLQLGCNGINGTSMAGGCDLSATNVSFGCASNNGTTCYTPASSCNNPVICTASTGASPSSLIPFILNNPFLQFAVQNDSSQTQRSVAGVRLGASTVSGPLSFGNLTSFSGYLSGLANLSMGAQNDIAITCGSTSGPCPGTAQSTNCGGHGCSGGDPANGQNFKNYQAPGQSLGLKDDYACASLLITLCAAFDSLTVNYSGVTRTNLLVQASGNRQTQALIYGTNLGNAVTTIANSMSVNQSNGLPAWLVNALIGLVIPSAELALDQQLATDLGVPLACLPNSCSQATVNTALNAYNVPYNLGNIHQIQVLPNAPFGLSFENQAIAYPGYVNSSTGLAQTVPTGWAMFAANATTLNISAPTSNFVSNIATGAAKAGNIIGLPGPYQNCFGSATFC